MRGLVVVLLFLVHGTAMSVLREGCGWFMLQRNVDSGDHGESILIFFAFVALLNSQLLWVLDSGS